MSSITTTPAIRPENIPDALKVLPQWLCWKYEEREDKSTKVPYNPRTGKMAKSNDSATWVNFEHALHAYESSQNRKNPYAGIGFVLQKKNGIVGGDLDHCIDSNTGEIAPWADEIIERINSYTEITPSGEGLRFFAYGTLPEGRRKSGNIEMYNDLRFLTMTGQRWQGASPDLEMRDDEIKMLHAESFPAAEKIVSVPNNLNGHANGNGSVNGHSNGNGHHSAAAGSDDHARLALAFNSKNGAKVRRLWEGSWQGDYASQSEADSALCFNLAFWFGKDPARVDSMFRQSGLMREKWDTKHHSSGETYGERTVAHACAKTAETYKPAPPLPKGFLRGRAARDYIHGEGDESTPADDDESTPGEEPDEIEEKHPYSVSRGRILFAIEKTTKSGSDTSYNVVCDLAAHIIEEIATEEGARSFKIEGRTASTSRDRKGRRFEFEISAEDFADEKRLKASLTTAAGAQSPVRKGMAGHLAPAIQLLTGDLIQARRFNRTGWLEGENKFLIPGRAPEYSTIELPRKLPYSVDPNARLEEGLVALDSLLRAQKTPLACVAATIAFQAPLAVLCNWRNERYAVFIAGRTGSLKSSWTQVLMALYGPGFMNDDQLIKWGEGATRNAIMNFATHAHDMPLLLDNYKPSTGGGERDFVNLIHNILEGGEKDRLNRSSQMRASRPVYAWPVVTGEDVPDSDAASLARVLVVPFPFPGGNDNPHLSKAQALAGHLCAVGAAWIDWLESEEAQPIIKNIAGRFPDRRTSWTARLRKMRSDMVNLNRVASNLASNQLTWEMMGACPALEKIVKTFNDAQDEGLSMVAGEMATQTAQSLEAARYLSALRELIASEKFTLVQRHASVSEHDRDRVIGWEDDNGVYLLPSVARQQVERLLGANGLGGLSDQTLYKQLDSLGAIVSHDADRLTKTVRVANGKQRVLHLSSGLLSEREDEDE